MHELSLCGAIVDTVNEHANGREVKGINLTIGHFRQVVPETLQFCWQMRTEDTHLSNCVLNINSVSAVIECNQCGESTTLTHPILICGSCESPDTTMVTGEEFLIESIDLKSATERPKESA